MAACGSTIRVYGRSSGRSMERNMRGQFCHLISRANFLSESRDCLQAVRYWRANCSRLGALELQRHSHGGAGARTGWSLAMLAAERASLWHSDEKHNDEAPFINQ